MLSLDHVYYRYAPKLPDVLRDVSYTFDRGRFYAIVGESGAGKSTLISLLTALDDPTAGTLTFEGQDLRRISRTEYRIRHVGLVFQGYNLLLRQSALDNVIVPLYLAGMPAAERQARAAALLESVGLSAEKHKRTILRLSGGEQQRVAVARAIANAPPLLIADEPTGNLDAVNTENILSLLCHLAHAEDRCVIVVTHDETVARAADVTLRIENGGMREIVGA